MPATRKKTSRRSGIAVPGLIVGDKIGIKDVAGKQIQTSNTRALAALAASRGLGAVSVDASLLMSVDGAKSVQVFGTKVRRRRARKGKVVTKMYLPSLSRLTEIVLEDGSVIEVHGPLVTPISGIPAQEGEEEGYRKYTAEEVMSDRAADFFNSLVD